MLLDPPRGIDANLHAERQATWGEREFGEQNRTAGGGRRLGQPDRIQHRQEQENHSNDRRRSKAEAADWQETQISLVQQ